MQFAADADIYMVTSDNSNACNADQGDKIDLLDYAYLIKISQDLTLKQQLKLDK